MPAVLEAPAPAIKDETLSPITVENGQLPVSPQVWEIPVARPTRQSTSLLHSIMSIFTKPQPKYRSEHATVTKKLEIPVDRAWRVDPYLCAKSLSG